MPVAGPSFAKAEKFLIVVAALSLVGFPDAALPVAVEFSM